MGKHKNNKNKVKMYPFSQTTSNIYKIAISKNPWISLEEKEIIPLDEHIFYNRKSVVVPMYNKEYNDTCNELFFSKALKNVSVAKQEDLFSKKVPDKASVNKIIIDTNYPNSTIGNFIRKPSYIKSLMCSKCAYIMYPSYIYPCTHSCCENCMNKSKFEQKDYTDQVINMVKCHTCKLNSVKATLNYSMNSVLETINVKCTGIDCSWTGELQQYRQHYGKCDKIMVKCVQCNITVSHLLFNDHINNRCTHRTVKCSTCLKEGYKMYLNDHIQYHCTEPLVLNNKADIIYHVPSSFKSTTIMDELD
jgi:hypothetical protein